MNRDQFLALAESRPVQEHESGVFLREMAQSVYQQVEMLGEKRNAGQELTAAEVAQVKWLVLSDVVCSENGEPLLKPEDKKAFSDFKTSLVESLFLEACVMAAMSEEDRAAFEKKSLTTPSS